MSPNSKINSITKQLLECSAAFNAMFLIMGVLGLSLGFIIIEMEML